MRRKLLKRHFGEGLDTSFQLITSDAGEREFIVGYTTQIQRRSVSFVWKAGRSTR